MKMENITLSEKQFTILADLLKNDIEDLANEPEFFEECDYNPKEYIDERIALCQLFKIDFWHIADLYCSHYTSGKLRAVYEGKPIKEYVEKYEVPSDAELAKGFLKALWQAKEGSNQ